MSARPRTRRTTCLAAVATAALATAMALPELAPALAEAPSAQRTDRAASASHGSHRNVPLGPEGGRDVLPSPPTPPSGVPQQPTRRKTRPGTNTLSARASVGTATAAAAAVPTRTYGPTGPARTLVLYDGSGSYGWLGELYAIAGGNLATHFGQVTAMPVSGYTAGQLSGYTAVLYFGSTYNEPLPAAFISDVTTSNVPVIWSGFNVWQLSGDLGSVTSTAFQARYGWDPSSSYLDTADALLTVSYKGQTLTRNALNGGGLLAPHITTPAAVTVLAQANCTGLTGAAVACAPIAQTTGTAMPWAIRSANLTYVGEIPFSYLSERDRYLAFADLLFPALGPALTASKQAAVRLEDVSPVSDPTVLRQFADYLYSQGVPFTVGVIPQYSDPRGTYNGGVAQTITLAQAPDVVSALKYLRTKGGTLIQHGYTHQYSNVANPYAGVTGEDFEFYRAQCSATQAAPYQFGACQDASWVILTGAVPGDSATWATNRVRSGRTLFAGAGLPTPTVFETPHYAATSADYQGIRQVYGTRYERELFFGGALNPANSSANVFGQFFPYSVTDLYGSKVLPENLGNFEPVVSNNNPPRSAQDIIANATANQVVTQSTASLFFHPDYPLTELQSIVTGIKGLGYTFVAAGSLK